MNISEGITYKISPSTLDGAKGPSRILRAPSYPQDIEGGLQKCPEFLNTQQIKSIEIGVLIGFSSVRIVRKVIDALKLGFQKKFCYLNLGFNVITRIIQNSLVREILLLL